MDKQEYIKYFPKALLDEIIAGRCLPFVGAGFSMNADSKDKKSKSPTWNELGVFFRKELLPVDVVLTKEQMSQTDGLEYITAYEESTDRCKLVDKMREGLCIDKIKVGKTHKAFCNLPFDIICTTNFDSLLEDGFKAVGKSTLTKIYETQLPLSCATEQVELLKMHGDINHPDSLIATESDYDGYIKNHPLMVTYLTNLLITRTPLFIGYSLDDTDFRQINKVVQDRLGKMTKRPYTIQFKCSDESRRRFERRGVTVIDLPVIGSRSYKDTLTRALNEVYKYCAQVSLSSVVDHEVAWQVQLPEGFSNNLALFVIPQVELSYYRDVIFPIVREAGFYPISTFDKLFIDSNFFTGTYQLMDKASVVCFDLDGGIDNEVWEQLLLNKDDKSFVGFTSQETVDFLTGKLYKISKPNVDGEDYLNEIDAIKNEFARIGANLHNVEDDVKKLERLHLYSEAYLKCYMQMERQVRSLLDMDLLKRGLTFAFTLDPISRYFNKKERQQIIDYSRKRNKLAHGEIIDITKEDITEALKINDMILSAINKYIGNQRT